MDVYTYCGRTVVWIGPGSGVGSWGPSNMAYAARTARGMGVDTICPKRAEGTVKWYNNARQLKAERAAALDQGAGYIPHFYSDGPKFGLGFVDKEADVILEMLEAAGSLCLDMEAEWDGQAGAAERLATRLEGHPGLLFINPWANPEQHNWRGVAAPLEAVAQGWIPQQYNDYLATQEPSELQDYGRILLPGVDLTAEFGVNHPISIARQAMEHGHPSLWLWEYSAMLHDPALVRSVVQVMAGASNRPPAPPPPPAPAGGKVTVQQGDTLSLIAQRNEVELAALEALNKGAIQAACAEHMVSFSYDHIWPGMVLQLP